ncbi:LytR/AlgR family response regulator transcription factor [Pedobacter caeni]|uniref:Two component transcriptional regulator, LytTR family n=1 Tax=Pedobacter caeni TaxID=288992 RepID=A0A1M4UGP5_9SPHI|nr:response regulator transcription factor [Pedobacter caeni]SHE55889.1 two component transcriptional regulator, LytTR family [Pedobacter caeni]
MDCIAIDDEPLALDVIQYHSEKIPFISVKSVFTDAFKALDYLQSNTVNLVFMDISMPDISGLQLVRSLPNPPMVIFTTAYSNYAAESYDLNAVDYLVKPIEFDRFLIACNKANAIYKREMNAENIRSGKFMIIKSGHESFKINFEDIQYIEAEGNLVNFVASDRKVTTRLSIKEVLKLLPVEKFIQVHRSFIISLSYLNKFENHQLIVANRSIPLGGNYKQQFIDFLNGNNTKSIS